MPDTSKMTFEEKVDASLAASTQLHDCLESHREETRVAFKALGDKLGELSVSQSINNGVTTALAKRLGVSGLDVKDNGEVEGVERVKPAVGAWSLKKALFVGLPLFTAFIALLQFLFLAAPGVAKAIYHAVMNMPG